MEFLEKCIIFFKPGNASHRFGVVILCPFVLLGQEAVCRGGGVLGVKQIFMEGDCRAALLSHIDDADTGMFVCWDIPFISLNDQFCWISRPCFAYKRVGVLEQGLPASHFSCGRSAEKGDGGGGPGLAIGVAVIRPAMFGVGDPVEVKAESVGENIFRRDAAVGEKGMVVEISGQPAPFFLGVSRHRQAQGENEQYQAG